jgi:single-strand DNA-binding protein
MSDGMNKVILLGNLGADPELRYTTAGVPVMNMRLATNESYLDKNREPQAHTEWHTVVLWGNRAEGLSRVLTRGSSVVIEGTLRTSSYEKEGTKRYRTEVHARDILFTGRRSVAIGGQAAAAPRESPGDGDGESPPSPETPVAEAPDVQGPRPRPTRPRARAPGFGPPKPSLDELPY